MDLNRETMRKELRVVVLGMMGRCPFGGQTWLYLNWLSGLRKLGLDVWYVEDDSVWPYDPEKNAVTDDPSYAIQHLARGLERIGLAGKWAFRLADREGASWGLSERDLRDLYRSCDVLLNIVGATDLREEHLEAPLRIYVETDPVTCELRLALGDEHTRQAFSDHHLIFTYGENFGAQDCGVPLNGLGPKYRKTRQPVDLDLWPMAYDPSARSFTTIGNYRQTGNDIKFDGDIYYWSKHREWERFADLPRRTSQPFELAMAPDDPRDREFLTSHGFRLVPPIPMSLDVFGAYPSYFRGSRAEFTVAKDQNVRLRSGWFSERDACYLACGKPVVTQDTGLSGIFPLGEGLFAFRTMEDAVSSIDAINGDYRRHCEAARRIAEEFFAAEEVAARLLGEAGLL